MPKDSNENKQNQVETGIPEDTHLRTQKTIQEQKAEGYYTSEHEVKKHVSELRKKDLKEQKGDSFDNDVDILLT